MMTLSRAEIEERALTLSAAALAEIEAARNAGEIGAPKIVSRCYVCCEEESMSLVNKLIAKGLSNREVTEACMSINARRAAGGDKRIIESYSVRQHRRWHFNVQKPAQAALRRILERRAEEANLDHINGIDNIVTEYALLESVMAKGFGTVTDENTTITVQQAMEAASRLHDMTARDASGRKMADMVYTVDRLIRAAQEFVPEELQEAFMARVEGKPIPREVIEAEPVSPAVREIIPARHDEGDEFS